jgi:hypothetical protein
MSRPTDQWWTDGAEKGTEREGTHNASLKLKIHLSLLKNPCPLILNNNIIGMTIDQS